MKRRSIVVAGLTIMALVLSGGGLMPDAQPAAAGTGETEREGLPGPNDGIQELPPPIPDVPQKGHKGLDSHLSSLVDAEARGEAESLAQSALIDLVDGDVRVVIESRPGQFETAIRAAAEYGTVENLTEIAGDMTVLVRISSLTALAGEDSIRLVRIPWKPSTYATSEA